MANYYFLITSFPPLALGAKPELSFKELDQLLLANLTERDLKKFNQLLLPIDLYNIRAFWLGMPLDDRGHIKAREIEEELLVQGALPPYVVAFLESYESTEERLRNFSSLYVSMYRELLPHLSGFLLKYFQFEREFRLVLTALRAKAAGKDLVRELQFEDPSDPLVLELLAQRDASDVTPPQEYEELKTLFVKNKDNPEGLNQKMLEYQFEKVELMEEPQEFGIDRVLAYVARFLFVEQLALLDKKQGMEQLSHYE